VDKKFNIHTKARVRVSENGRQTERKSRLTANMKMQSSRAVSREKIRIQKANKSTSTQ
jgi:hypothetical protein